MTTRDAQRARTRQAIVRAAAGMLERGERPDLEGVAAQAGVSRATAYRYFPGLDALLSEAAVDALMPEPGALFAEGAPGDPAERVLRVDAATTRAIREREAPLRLMLARVLERSLKPGAGEAPLRQNRRGPLIERALSPVAEGLGPAAQDRLVAALSMVIGAEGFVALSDVVGLDAEDADAVRQWTIRALVNAALTEG